MILSNLTPVNSDQRRAEPNVRGNHVEQSN